MRRRFGASATYPKLSAVPTAASGSLCVVSEIVIERRQDPGSVLVILRSLPDWFGIEEAIRNYVRSAGQQPSYLAVRDGETVGVALVVRHFPESAELSLLAVHANHRRNGAGRALVDAVAKDLQADGASVLIVHTVGPSFEDAAYAQTRAFYRGVGFVPVQEFQRIDWDGPTLVLVRVL